MINHTPRPVDVELIGTLCRGMTVVDQRANPGREANVAHGHCVDRAAALHLVLGGAAARG